MKAVSQIEKAHTLLPNSKIVQLIRKNSNLGKAWAQQQLGSYYHSVNSGKSDA